MSRPRKKPLMPTTIQQETTAQRLIKLRKRRGLTQVQLAEAVGITRETLSNYELGRAHLNDDTIIRFVEILKTSADEILGLTKESNMATGTASIRFVRRMQKIDELSPTDQKAILRTIDGFLNGVECEAAHKIETDE